VLPYVPVSSEAAAHIHSAEATDASNRPPITGPVMGGWVVAFGDSVVSHPSPEAEVIDGYADM
jgi:hypothetical protein